MKPVFRFASAAALVFAAGATLAAAPVTDTTREERMDQALQNYRAQHGDDSASQTADQAGPMARAEESVKRGARKTANAIKHGAQKTGEFVGKGVRKTGEAIHNAGEKLESKSTGSSQ